MERKVKYEPIDGKTWVSTIGLILFALAFVFDATLGTADSVPMAGPGICLAGLGALIVLIGIAQSKSLSVCRGITFALVALCAWGGYLFIRIQWSPFPYLADLDLFLLVSAFLSMAVGVLHPDKILLSRIFTVAVVIGVLLNGWAAFLQYKAGESISPLQSLGLIVPLSGVRCTGLFFHANPFGCFSAVASLWLLFSLFNPTIGKLLRIVCAVTFCVGVFCVFSSVSRAAFAATLVGGSAGAGLLFFGWMRSRDHWKGKAAVLLGFIFLAAIVIAGGIYAGKDMLEKRGYDDTNLEKGMEISGRNYPWLTAMEMFSVQPMTGHGPRGFYRNENAYWSESFDAAQPNFEHPHNEFLEQLTDYGAVGLVLGVIGLGSLSLGAASLALGSSRIVLSNSRNPMKVRVGKMALPSAAGAFAVIVAACVDGMFSFNMHFVPNVLLVGGVSGILLGVKNRVAVLEKGVADSGETRSLGFFSMFTLCVLAAGTFSFGSIATVLGARYANTWWPIQLAKNEYKQGELSKKDYLDVLVRKSEQINRYPFYYRSGVSCRALVDEPRGLDEGEQMTFMLKSADHLAKACALAPFDVQSHREYATTLMRLGRFDEAEKYQEKALELGWRREYYYQNTFTLAQLQYVRAIVAMNNVDHSQASAALRRAVATIERGTPKMKLDGRERAKLLKKKIDEEIAFLKRTNEWSRKTAAPHAMENEDR